MIRRRLAGVVSAAALGLAGCGGDDEKSQATTHASLKNVYVCFSAPSLITSAGKARLRETMAENTQADAKHLEQAGATEAAAAVREATEKVTQQPALLKDDQALGRTFVVAQRLAVEAGFSERGCKDPYPDPY